ncbi:hypothetical protein CPLU01_03421 [Colletotrichum plurivorum]|uniref:Uncharacterized protein n=1 Tax=Colletotrichum plurivorum TaxID=2175906 RepID=A0A8H6NLB7_9PEZI|nr:hypothetical protein CPLU01_03421 [Colletotrichum plurivorum]
MFSSRSLRPGSAQRSAQPHLVNSANYVSIAPRRGLPFHDLEEHRQHPGLHSIFLSNFSRRERGAAPAGSTQTDRAPHADAAASKNQDGLPFPSFPGPAIRFTGMPGAGQRKFNERRRGMTPVSVSLRASPSLSSALPIEAQGSSSLRLTGLPLASSKHGALDDKRTDCAMDAIGPVSQPSSGVMCPSPSQRTQAQSLSTPSGTPDTSHEERRAQAGTQPKKKTIEGTEHGSSSSNNRCNGHTLLLASYFYRRAFLLAFTLSSYEDEVDAR